MSRARVWALLDGAIITTEASIAHALASHALADKRTRAGARNDRAIFSIESGRAEARAVIGALALTRARVGTVLGLTSLAMEATHANALAGALGSVGHAKAVAAALIVAHLNRAIAPTVALLAGAGAVVALALAGALIGTSVELTSITSVARVGRLCTLAGAFNTLTAA